MRHAWKAITGGQRQEVGSQWLVERLAKLMERATGSGADRVSKNKGVTEVHPTTGVGGERAWY